LSSILDIFDFKQSKIDENHIDAVFSTLSFEEKKVFDLIKISNHALTATQIYDYYIDKILNDNPDIKKEIKALQKKIKIKNKKPLEIKANFIRQNKIKVPTNRTITRTLDNLKDAGFLVKRKPTNSKVKAYYSVIPKLKVALNKKDPEIIKKNEIDQMINKINHMKKIIKKHK
jgi:DNA-binding PadR family transcriptional regulator